MTGFEAFIREKHIVAQIKEKEQAKEEYKVAVAQGKGAYLLEEEQADIFSCSLGNIPPRTKIVIKVLFST